jgi:FAD/FMN-containing dehydrogenase
MIDLSLMKTVDVDPDAQTISCGGGTTWSELNEAAHVHELATTGGVISTTGVAGLTLGGGIGWTMGKWGMAVDNLVWAEVVLANGEIVQASDTTEPDLFWAIRGGGGNFGVVTRFTFRAYPLSSVLGGPMIYPLEAAPDVVRFVREFGDATSDDVSLQAAFIHAPDGSGMKVCAIAVCHIGTDEAQAEADLKPLREFGEPLVDLISRMPYPAVNTQIDALFPRGTLNYWKSAFFSDPSDEAVAKMIAAFQGSPTTMCALILEHFAGEVTRIDPMATAFPHRAPGDNLVIAAQWTDRAQTDECITWARELFAGLRPHMSDAAYVNYLAAEDVDRVRAAYGPNYDRLVELKRRYDPDNLFRLNQNISP